MHYYSCVLLISEVCGARLACTVCAWCVVLDQSLSRLLCRTVVVSRGGGVDIKRSALPFLTILVLIAREER